MKQDVRYNLGSVRSRFGRPYRAIAIGRPRSDGMWEGLIEFVDLIDLRSLATDVETTQPDADAFRYWAEGVGVAFLEGALERATRRAAGVVAAQDTEPLGGSPTPPAILNPFEVYEQGENLLLDQLDALETERVRDIVRAYELIPLEFVDSLTRAELVAAIVSAVRAARHHQMS